MLAERRVALDVLIGIVVFFSVFGAAFHVPLPPATGTEASWMTALGEAVRTHLTFGRDVIYTYGPLGYLAVPGIVPGTYAAKILFAFAIACASAALVLLRMRSEGGAWQRLAFVIGALMIFPYTNTLYFAGEADAQIFFLLALLFTFPAISREKPVRTIALSLGLLAGFLSLIKFSLFVSTLVIGLATFAARVAEHRKSPELRRADIEAAALYAVGFAASSAGIYYCVTYGFRYEAALAVLGIAAAVCWIARLVPAFAYVAIAAACCTWITASEPYREYLYYSLQIAGGYTSAVAREATSAAVLTGFLLLAMAALLAIRERTSLGTPRLVALLTILLVAFRQGFVRQDPAHIFPYLLTASFAGCILILCSNQARTSIYAAFLVVLSLPSLPSFSNYGQVAVPVEKFPIAIADGLRGAFGTIAGWRRNFDELPSNDEAGLMPDEFSAADRQKMGSEPVDLVGTETNIVFANGLKWKPRPAFDAPYSVFTPRLDALNRNAIRAGSTGRELLTYQSVDHKYPLGDEPMANRELVCNYAADRRFASAVSTHGGIPVLILQQTPGRCGEPATQRLGTIGWNESLALPNAPGKLAFLYVDVRYSLLGKALKSLYQIAPVWAVVRYRSGFTANYRVLPELLQDGLLVNPMPKGIEGVRALFTGTNIDPAETLELTCDSTWLFSPAMSYQLQEVPYRKVAP